jgi:ligand-binding sensor domain-containing protein
MLLKKSVCCALTTLLFSMAIGCTRSAPPDTPQPVWTNYQLNANVFALAVEGTRLWVGTERGLILYDLLLDRITARYDSQNGLVSDIVTAVKLDAAGNKWVGTHGGGLSRFDGKRWTHYTVPDLADPYVYDIVFDRDGSVWVANWRGVSIYDGRSAKGGWRSYTKADGIADDWVYAITIDRDGTKWLGTENGVTRYDGRTFKNFTHEDGLGAPIEVIGDYEPIENPSLHHANVAGKQAEGYNPNYILAATVDRLNHKWFGTWGAGLARFDDRAWTNYTTKDGLSGNFVSDVVLDESGRLWAATEGGVSRFDGKRWVSLTMEDGLIGESVFAVALDPQGFPWFGALGGVSRLEGFRF